MKAGVAWVGELPDGSAGFQGLIVKGGQAHRALGAERHISSGFMVILHFSRALPVAGSYSG